MHVIFATYLHNVTTLPCKVPNNVSSSANHGVKHSAKHVLRIVNCIELTNKMHLSGNLVSFITVKFL